MGLEPLFRQLVGHGHERRLAEVLGAQLSRQRQTRRCEQHLLADLGGIGHVRHGNELGRVFVAAEDGIEGDIGLDEGLEDREVLAKVGRCARDGLDGRQSLALNGHQQGKVGRRRQQRAEGLLELLGGCLEILRSAHRKGEGPVGWPLHCHGIRT